MNTKKRIACALLLCAAGIGMAGLQCSLAIRRYTVQSGKVAAGRQLRIVMLSDLHSYVYGANQSPLLKRVAAERPDVILLCGDIVDDKEPQQGWSISQILHRVTMYPAIMSFGRMIRRVSLTWCSLAASMFCGTRGKRSQ